MRLRSLVHLLHASGLAVACSNAIGCDPTTYTPPSGVTTVEVVEVPRVVQRSFRATVRLSGVLPATAAVRVALIEGRADEATVDAFARGRPSAGQRAKELPTIAVRSRDALLVQPTRAAARGLHTLVVALPGRPPHVSDLTVEGEPPAARAYPHEGVVLPGAAVTHCAATVPVGLPARGTWLSVDGTLHEAALTARTDVPCVELAAPEVDGTFLPPPELGGWAIDPGPVVVDDRAPRPVGPCPEPWSALADGLCARIDDDRIVFAADDPAQLLLARVGGRPLVAALGTGARAWVRGLPPGRPLVVDGVLRGDEDVAFSRALVTAPRRRHVVVNEVLARPPSGAATQRWIELGNDGDEAVELLDLVLLDGVERVALPATSLPPGGLALVVGVGFSPGLAGDVPPAKGTTFVTVPTLRLTGDVALIERDGRRLSTLPFAGTRKNASRGRRALDVPDDAPDAFGWDASLGATPGRTNQIGP